MSSNFADTPCGGLWLFSASDFLPAAGIAVPYRDIPPELRVEALALDQTSGRVSIPVMHRIAVALRMPNRVDLIAATVDGFFEAYVLRAQLQASVSPSWLNDVEGTGLSLLLMYEDVFIAEEFFEGQEYGRRQLLRELCSSGYMGAAAVV